MLEGQPLHQVRLGASGALTIGLCALHIVTTSEQSKVSFTCLGSALLVAAKHTKNPYLGFSLGQKTSCETHSYFNSRVI